MLGSNCPYSPRPTRCSIPKLLIIFIFCFALILILELPKKLALFSRFQSSEVSTTVVSQPEASLRNLTNCLDKSNAKKIIQHGDFWLLENYVPASTYFRCDESITYTTHGEFSFLDNVVPLLERWQGPLSIALYAPGNMFQITLDTIMNLRNCDTTGQLVKKFVSFHIYFEARFAPDALPRDLDEYEKNFSCLNFSPNLKLENSTKTINNLTYPINVGRNLARQAALTHFILASDIELYPSLGLIESFLEMVTRDPDQHLRGHNVYPLPIFEVKSDKEVPASKTALIEMFQKQDAIWFHFQVCPRCHKIPRADEWISVPSDTAELKVFTSVKRQGDFFTWEPIYIGTNDEPLYDERINWEGKSDKMSQAYIMCVLDYDFNVLTNAFLVHKPGIKTKAESERPREMNVNSAIIKDIVAPEIEKFYGSREGCKWVHRKITKIK